MTSFRFLANERTAKDIRGVFLDVAGKQRTQLRGDSQPFPSLGSSLPRVASFKSNMASLPFVGTPESDDDVDQLDNESDSDEEPEKVFRHYISTYSPFMPVSERFLLVCSLSRERKPRRETDRCLRTTFSSSQENWRIIFKIHGISTLLLRLQSRNKSR